MGSYKVRYFLDKNEYFNMDPGNLKAAKNGQSYFSCALWSSEVYEEVDGSLQNISQAIKRGTKLQW